MTAALLEGVRILQVDGIFAEVDHPVTGSLAVTGMPVLAPDGERSAVLPAPRMGEHTDEVVAELAGRDPATSAQLRSNRVIGY